MLSKKIMKEAAAYWGRKGGAIGGKSTSPAKIAAILENAKKARAARKNKSKRK